MLMYRGTIAWLLGLVKCLDSAVLSYIVQVDSILKTHSTQTITTFQLCCEVLLENHLQIYVFLSHFFGRQAPGCKLQLCSITALVYRSLVGMKKGQP